MCWRLKGELPPQTLPKCQLLLEVAYPSTVQPQGLCWSLLSILPLPLLTNVPCPNDHMTHNRCLARWDLKVPATFRTHWKPGLRCVPKPWILTNTYKLQNNKHHRNIPDRIGQAYPLKKSLRHCNHLALCGPCRLSCDNLSFRSFSHVRLWAFCGTDLALIKS
jgi:hypothetical protein